MRELPDPRDVVSDFADNRRVTPIEAWRLLGRFWRFVRPYRGKFLLSLLLVLASVPLTQFALFLTRDVTDKALLATGLTPDARWAIVLKIVGLQALFTVASAILWTLREVMEWYGGMRATFDLRLAFYRHLHALPLAFLSRRAPGEHLYRATTDMVSMFRSSADGVAPTAYANDVDPYDPGIMGMIVRTAPLVVETVSGVVWAGVFLAIIDPVLSLALALYVVPYAVLSSLMYGRVRRSAFDLKGRTEIEAGVLRDHLAGLRTLKAFGRLALGRRDYQDAATATRRRAIEQAFGLVLTQNVVQAGTKWAFGVGIYVYVALRVLGGQATIGDWLATFLLVEAAQLPLEKLVQLLQLVRMQLVPAQRVLDTLDAPVTLADRPGAPWVEPTRGAIRFEGASLSYTSERVALDRLSVEIRAGEYVGIVGPSGAGKSTLVALLLRLYGADAGRVLVDGHDVREVQIAGLLSGIATVPQSVFLYSGTVASNILFGNPRATAAQVEEAVEFAGLAPFVARLPQGLQTEVGEGATISGGERQRIGIARALVRDPRILILDEATSGLDPETEDLVLRSVDALRRGRTVLSIAHRLKAVAGCDRVLVLDRGRLVQDGAPGDLAQRAGAFRDLWSEQRREEEAIGMEVGVS